MLFLFVVPSSRWLSQVFKSRVLTFVDYVLTTWSGASQYSSESSARGTTPRFSFRTSPTQEHHFPFDLCALLLSFWLLSRGPFSRHTTTDCSRLVPTSLHYGLPETDYRASIPHIFRVASHWLSTFLDLSAEYNRCHAEADLFFLCNSRLLSATRSSFYHATLVALEFGCPWTWTGTASVPHIPVRVIVFW